MRHPHVPPKYVNQSLRAKDSTVKTVKSKNLFFLPFNQAMCTEDVKKEDWRCFFGAMTFFSISSIKWQHTLFLAKMFRVFQFFDRLSFSGYYNFVGFSFCSQITSRNRVNPNKPARSAQKWTKGDPLFSSFLSIYNHLQNHIDHRSR